MKGLVIRVYHKLVKIQDWVVNEKLAYLCCKSRLLSSIYYFFFNPSFSRELQAVLAGKVKHLEEVKKTNMNYYLLVRNTHRLEKGLLMRPKKEIFAKDYIQETVESFEGIWKSSEMNANPQMKWFYDVLDQYFKSSGHDPLIDKLYKRFNNKIQADNFKTSNGDCKSIPYSRDPESMSNISYEQFYLLSRQRRSVRWYLSKKVPRELIDKAILAANQAPSACNRQPFEYRIFDNPLLVQEVISYPMGTKGYGHSIPVLIVLVGNLDAYYSERDRHVIYIDASLAAMSLMFALETLGLSSCPINWPDIEKREKKMASFLKLKKFQRPIMCIGLGYPDPTGMVAFSEKRTLDQTRLYNK